MTYQPETPLPINENAVDRLFDEDQPSDLIALYIYLCYHAVISNSTTLNSHCLREQAKNQLNIGETRFKKAFNRLQELDFVERIRETDRAGRVRRWLIVVKGLNL